MKLISIEIHGLTVEQTIFVALWSWSRATTFQHCDFFMYWQGLRPILTCSTYLWRICGGAIWAHCPSYRPIDSFGDLPCQPFRLLIWTHSWSFYRLKPFFIWILLTNLRNTRRPWRWVLRNSQTFGNCTGTFAWFQRSSKCPCLVHIFGIWESFYHRYQQPLMASTRSWKSWHLHHSQVSVYAGMRYIRRCYMHGSRMFEGIRIPLISTSGFLTCMKIHNFARICGSFPATMPGLVLFATIQLASFRVLIQGRRRSSVLHCALQARLSEMEEHL